MLTSVFWASSFPFIKIVVNSIGGYNYVWLRSLIALLVLSPYVLLLYRRGLVGGGVVRGGLYVGVAYALGLWLQGIGTGITSASNSAFITGLNVVFVHLYAGLVLKRYSSGLAVSLILSVLGLYLLTGPGQGPNLGDLLVLLGAVAWAAQVILVDRVSGWNPFVVVFFELLPSVFFAVPGLLSENSFSLRFDVLVLVFYLAVVCTIAAFSLQVYGQRFVEPEVASLVFLLEPVFAAVFSNIVLGEVMEPVQVAGGVLILAALAISIRSRYYEKTSPNP